LQPAGPIRPPLFDAVKRVYIVGTADTKGPELLYIKALVEGAGAPAVLVDIGTRASGIPVDVSAAAVAAAHPTTAVQRSRRWVRPLPASSSRATILPA
jgi:Uncharacterised protein family (UPF0261)